MRRDVSGILKIPSSSNNLLVIFNNAGGTSLCRNVPVYECVYVCMKDFLNE